MLTQSIVASQAMGRRSVVDERGTRGCVRRDRSHYAPEVVSAALRVRLDVMLAAANSMVFFRGPDCGKVSIKKSGSVRTVAWPD